QRLGIVPGQIATDLLPRLAAVRRLPDVLRRCVENVWIDRGEDDRKVPLPALDQRARRFAGEHTRVGTDLACLVGLSVQTNEKRSVVATRVEDVGIPRVGRDVAGFCSAGAVGWRNSAAAAASATSTAASLA